jgi:hypothetical protein
MMRGAVKIKTNQAAFPFCCHIHSFKRNPEFNGPLDPSDKVGWFVGSMFRSASFLFVVLVVLETDKVLHDNHKSFFHFSQLFLAILVTGEYMLSLWSVVVNQEYSAHPCYARLRWASSAFPVLDFIVISAFWTSEVCLSSKSQNCYDQQFSNCYFFH